MRYNINSGPAVEPASVEVSVRVFSRFLDLSTTCALSIRLIASAESKNKALFNLAFTYALSTNEIVSAEFK